ncbi:proline--tRNA ligase, partial [Candidatus Woesearchaeota archaeon]|nr:proline--tRNA ligase [Candidatus Woesearchaeota archaeon]
IEQKGDHEERYALRPTSEAIINDSYAKWIRSWRDLPLKLNQWANIIRWEVQDCKLFLRTREFLWQEGHCVYETEEECHKETLHYLERYRQVSEDLLAIPVWLGRKTEREKFAGAKETYGIEGFMPDGKALQMGTSHDLGQNFAKAFGINFQSRDEKPTLPWQNSWGISTRLIGAVIMTHGDDKGLIIPPRAAKHKVAIVPIIFKGDTTPVKECEKLAKELKEFKPILDAREEYSAGWKFNKYELEGIPLRVEMGPRDIKNDEVVIVRRDTGEKISVKRKGAGKKISALLETMHTDMFAKAKKEASAMILTPKNYEDFKKNIKDRKVNYCAHCGNDACELAIKEETAATTRNIPLGKEAEPKKGFVCIKCGKAAEYMVYFARAY